MRAFIYLQSFLLFLVVAPLACDAIFFNDPILIPSFECILKFVLLNYGPEKFERYETYFRSESVMEMAQTGQYFGPHGIQEYIRFAFGEFSPYFVTGPDDSKIDVSYQGYENGQCVFLAVSHALFSMDPSYTRSSTTFRSAFMFKMYFDFGDNYISRINIYFSEPLLDSIFNNFLNADQTRQHVCDTSTGPMCANLIETPSNCLAAFQALPVADERNHVDGNSQGCRALHAVFAAVNDEHCPHISLNAQLDVNGKIKCQTVGNNQPEDLFTTDDIAKFLQIEQAAGIDPTTGIKIIDPSAITPLPCGLFGLGIFCLTVNGCDFFSWLLGLCARA